MNFVHVGVTPVVSKPPRLPISDINSLEEHSGYVSHVGV